MLRVFCCGNICSFPSCGQSMRVRATGSANAFLVVFESGLLPLAASMVAPPYSLPVLQERLKWFICTVESIWAFLSWRYAAPFPSLWLHSLRDSSTIKIFAMWMQKPGWDPEDLCCKNQSFWLPSLPNWGRLTVNSHTYMGTLALLNFSLIFLAKLSKPKFFFLSK